MKLSEEDMNKLMWHLLIQWLAHKDSLGEWLDNINYETVERSINSSPRGALGNVFIWSSSNEGITYWSILDQQWSKIYIKASNYLTSQPLEKL